MFHVDQCIPLTWVMIFIQQLLLMVNLILLFIFYLALVIVTWFKIIRNGQEPTSRTVPWRRALDHVHLFCQQVAHLLSDLWWALSWSLLTCNYEVQQLSVNICNSRGYFWILSSLPSCCETQTRPKSLRLW